MSHSQAADSKTHTYQVVIGRPPEHKVYEYRTDLSGAKRMIARQFPGTTCVLRGYTTYQIRQGDKIIGSMQRTA